MGAGFIAGALERIIFDPLAIAMLICLYFIFFSIIKYAMARFTLAVITTSLVNYFIESTNDSFHSILNTRLLIKLTIYSIMLAIFIFIYKLITLTYSLIAKLTRKALASRR